MRLSEHGVLGKNSEANDLGGRVGVSWGLSSVDKELVHVHKK